MANPLPLDSRAVQARKSPRPSELLYDAVATGMWIYTRAAFRTIVLGERELRMRAGLLAVATHRSDADVPLICSTLFFADRMWRRHHLRLHFAARDDLFQRGVLAGLAPGLPLRVRRLLFALDPAPFLPLVRVNPIRGTTTVKVAQVLATFAPTAALDAALPDSEASRFRTEARELGVESPVTVGEAFRPEFAGLLWRDLAQSELDGPAYRDLWQARAQGAAADLRRLIALVRAGEPLLLFPEGRPSADGTIGPLRRGLDLLVRRGKPKLLLPLAIAYDPLTAGRTLAYLSVGEPFAPPSMSIDSVILEALRRTMPLTCAQVVSHSLLQAVERGVETVTAGALEADVAGAAARAKAERRACDPRLAAVAPRRRRLSECLAALVALGLVRTSDGRGLVLDRRRLATDPHVRRAAREYASAREGLGE